MKILLIALSTLALTACGTTSSVNKTEVCENGYIHVKKGEKLVPKYVKMPGSKATKISCRH